MLLDGNPSAAPTRRKRGVSGTPAQASEPHSHYSPDSIHAMRDMAFPCIAATLRGARPRRMVATRIGARKSQRSAVAAEDSADPA
jgi:hypothetical protein